MKKRDKLWEIPVVYVHLSYSLCTVGNPAVSFLAVTTPYHTATFLRADYIWVSTLYMYQGYEPFENLVFCLQKTLKDKKFNDNVLCIYMKICIVADYRAYNGRSLTPFGRCTVEVICNIYSQIYVNKIRSFITTATRKFTAALYSIQSIFSSLKNVKNRFIYLYIHAGRQDEMYWSIMPKSRAKMLKEK